MLRKQQLQQQQQQQQLVQKQSSSNSGSDEVCWMLTTLQVATLPFYYIYLSHLTMLS